MNWRVNTNPEANGEYLLAEFLEENADHPYNMRVLGFTTEAGWNTKKFPSGNLEAEYSFGFEPAAAWAWIPIEETGVANAVKSNRPVARG